MEANNMDLETWLKSGRYLPMRLRDFHDQKDVFKALFETIQIPDNLKHITWVDAHIFTIDIFLWWMARRGYTLRKCRRTRPGFFVDFDKSVAEAKERRDAQDVAMLKQWLSQGASAHSPEPNPKRGSPPFPEVEAAGGGSNSPDVINTHSAFESHNVTGDDNVR